ncbi:alpha-2-macroglobulin [Verrucomicrobiota bacterium sgz303538]
MLGTLRRLVCCIVGEFSWKPPGWLLHSYRATVRWSQLHRGFSVSIVLLLLLTTSGAWLTHRWYEKRPKPVTISVTVTPPGVTPLGKQLNPQPLEVAFGSSVAKLEDTPGKPLLSGVRIEPPVEGTWVWKSDTLLSFTPKTDWPAEQKYRVVLDPKLFPAHVKLEHYELETTTPAFTASMPKLEFYTDPKDPTVKQVVATIEFTHSIAPGELEKRIALTMVGGSPVFKEGEAPFTISYGLHNRVAYLHTSPLTLPEREDFMRVVLSKGLPTVQGGAQLHADLEQKVRVPDLYSFFKINEAEGLIVHTVAGDPEQVLMIRTSTPAKSEEIQKQLKVYLLPKKEATPSDSSDQEKKEEDDGTWDSAQEIDADVLQRATLLPVTLVPSKEENSKDHTFKITLEADGQLYIAIAKGVRALGGFVLGEDYAKVMPVPELPRDITIQGEGGVLALSGERKLSIKSRGVDMIEYEIARVPADQINHLVSQTRGEFQNPDFINYRFNEENLARIYVEKQPINVQSRFKANYSAFDFSRHLRATTDGGSAMQGLFFLKARAWHPPKKKADENDQQNNATNNEESEDDERGERTNIGDGRFILVTDMGMVVKENADGSRDIFIASIKTGVPMGGVSVEVLAKNGVPLLQGTTDADGRVTFASRGKLEREKRPVAYVARNGDDVAFMPYSREDRALNFSRFDIGGIQSVSGTELDAFIFTERGIYRPGDEIRIGVIAKQRDWQGNLEGLPLEVEVLDPKGSSVQVQKLILPPSGFAETTYQTAYQSPSGVYDLRVSLVRDKKHHLLLGSTSVNVKEFLPDRMKIESRLSRESKSGWIAPEGIQADVSLRNLYGTPATNRVLSGHIQLTPARFEFPEYPNYTFFDRLLEGKEEGPKSQKVELGEKTTDDQGAARFDLHLERFGNATYAATFFVEGFEAGSGRSVTTHNSVLVSPLPYVVGCKRNKDLSYTPVGSELTVEWIALDPGLQKLAVENLEARLIEHTHVSVLSKQEDGTWGYESVQKDNIVRTETIGIPAAGLKYPLPTATPGNFELELRDNTGTRVGSVSFCIVGKGAVTRSLEKNAELEIKLSRPQYNTGDEIEISIVAPYTGSGLITIERDKVYTHTWFKADQTSTIQRIRLPDDFEGTGYVNVCFVRALDSKEVFMSPLSYAVAPFRANIEKHRIPITLRTPAKATPGEPLHIGYKTDRPSKIAVFAVDQGILQVSDYKLPDPLSYFFRKAALMVGTSQIVDLILPEFSVLRNASAFGGDAEKQLNPFKRVTEKPVVYWSGIVDADATEREVIYNVPDYFSGTLTVMAVAVSPDAVGSAETNSLVRGSFVITPSVPTVAAPGDQFDISVTVANGVEGSGENAEIQLAVTPSEHLEIVKAPAQPLRISEGHEASATFTVRALERLGSASLGFSASTGGKESKLRSTLSVRPPIPFMTSLRGGNFMEQGVEIPVERPLRPEFRKTEATIAALPLGLANGLDAYLQSYPNGCSEQLTSAAFCRLMLADEVDFGLKRSEVNAQLERTFAMLRGRQNDQGSFGYWTSGESVGCDFVSVYVMHFLIEAKDAGFMPPSNVLQSGLRRLQQLVISEPHNLREARVIAYAIYLLTREGVITTNYILNLRDYLDKSFEKQWPTDLTSVYLAGSWALLKKSDEAQRLIEGYRLSIYDSRETWDFYSPLIADSQYVAMLARHFPAMLDRISPTSFQAIVKPIGEGRFNTLSAAYAVLALKSYSQHLAKNAPELGMSEVSAGKVETPLNTSGSALLKRAAFSAEAAALRFTARKQSAGLGTFYQVVEAGFDKGLPNTPVADGLEVFREFLDERDTVTNTARVGEPITVRIRIRSLTHNVLTNVALVDLLPGGFEVAAGSLQPGPGVKGCDYVEVREDRNVFFGDVGPLVREIRYQIKPTNRGEFVVPPVFAESMYDRAVKARGLSGKIVAEDR